MSLLTASYVLRWVLCSNNPAIVKVSVKQVEMVERIYGDSLSFHLLSCESWIFVKQKPGRKKNNNNKSKLWFTTCKNRISVYVDKERLESFMTEVPIIQKPVHWFSEHIFLDYDKIIDICASKYQRRMLLINPLSKN